MDIKFSYGRDRIELHVPQETIVYKTAFPPAAASAEEAVLEAVRNPVGSTPLQQALQQQRGKGKVVIVVSDNTRPIPYSAFLPALLSEIENGGVAREEIIVLVATGAHRPTTSREKMERFGPEILGSYCIVDHACDADSLLVAMPCPSWSGASVKVNRYYVEAGFRITTGLVEPHFMAGFSGGRKSICPGLCALETVRNFHGPKFQEDPRACNANLAGNPLHEEALSVARMVGIDFSIEVVLDTNRKVVRAFAGQFEQAHSKAVQFTTSFACVPVEEEADVVVTSSGGYPLDDTFYQCVKGFVSCLPAVRKEGTIIALGQCSEGVGSSEYTGLMRRYEGKWKQFLDDIMAPDFFVKDQWQFQMHTRALEKVGEEHLHFVTESLTESVLSQLPVNGASVPRSVVGQSVQEILDHVLLPGETLAVFPEGPYCVPICTGKEQVLPGAFY